MKYIDYREKLGLGFSDEDKKTLFINRVNIWLSKCYDIPYSEESEYKFSYEIGYPFLFQSEKVSDFGNAHNYNKFDADRGNLRRVEHYLRNYENSVNEFLACLVVMHNTYEDSDRYKKFIFDNIITILDDCRILYDVITDEDGIFIFPKGAKELDYALVSEPLEWLSQYPNSHRAFIKALKAYSENSIESASEVADLFRKALETFFQEFFGSEKSLENFKSEYGTYMKEHGVSPEIYNSLEKLLVLYANFMNSYAKHHDRVNCNLLEFIMYQTGNIIRLMIKLKNIE